MSEALFLRLLSYEDKSTKLAELIEAVSEGHKSNQAVHLVETDSFRYIPSVSFAYWVSERIRLKFVEFPRFESHGREVRVGDHPGDGFKYLRLFWEVPVDTSDHNWIPYQKGGTYSPFYSDIHLLVDWDITRQTYRGFYGRLGRPNERPSNYQYFFRPGLTWPRRTTSGISIRILPQGCIFADKGPTVFANDKEREALLALMNSQAFEALVALQLGAADAAARSYEVGLIQNTPVPDLSGPQGIHLGEIAMACVQFKCTLDTANEISHVFHLPALLQVMRHTLMESIATWRAKLSETELLLAKYQHEIDDSAFLLYGIEGGDRRTVEEFVGSAVQAVNNKIEEVDIGDEESTFDTNIDVQSLVSNLLSYIIGCAFGRWDVRYTTDERSIPDLPDPFAPLPACSPAMLIGHDDLPLHQVPAEYPLTINWEGVLVDDQDHSDDIVRHVQVVLRLIWHDRADSIEQETCQILGIKELREYFRRPGNGGFWMDHVRRYSKSRRKAPIYWLLQSTNKNYALWFYYHRLDKDSLFKALTKYVEPKIRLEDSRLEQWRMQLAEAGSEGREVKQLERQLERQESLVAELYDFRDKLRRVADLNITTDLNDGVVLNIAPLWELVPWGEAKKYWEELQAGKYEWSSISKQLRERGVI
jgi:hypothetical protein